MTIPPTRPSIHGFSLKKVYPCSTRPTTSDAAKIIIFQSSDPFVSTIPNRMRPSGACSQKFLCPAILLFSSSSPPSPLEIFFPRLIWITPIVNTVAVAPSAIPAKLVNGNLTVMGLFMSEEGVPSIHLNLHSYELRHHRSISKLRLLSHAYSILPMYVRTVRTYTHKKVYF